MARMLVALGVILAGIFGTVSSFVHRSADWVERLNVSQTFSIVATTTAPIPLEPSKPLLSKKEDIATPSSGTIPTSPVDPKPQPLPLPKPVVVKKVTPPPVTAQMVPQGKPASVGVINEKMIIDLTNVERVREGASVLAWNQQLAQMAYAKAKDMLERQYFAHESPNGKNVAGLAEDAGYVYRLVGENLAVGNFRSNEELIAGWMNSPGHRENMLKREYTEMGAAAIEGIFEGAPVWMAVQEFGKPFPLCDKPSVRTKEEIDAMTITLASLDEGIASAKNAVESSVNDDVRNQKIADYNALIDVYNGLVPELKILISTYNNSVNVYNACTTAP